MSYLEILKEIDKLPLDKKLEVVEHSIKLIRAEEKKQHLSDAVNELYEEYATNKELTAFADLDFENFYEAR